jgi:hypothetical protein
MSCTITPSTPPSVKIDIMIGNEAMNRYRKDYYGMSGCKVGYKYSYLADLKFLLEMSTCANSVCECYCNCSSEQIKEKINTL